MLNLSEARQKITTKNTLLFDCDGTLADTMPAHKMAYRLSFDLNKVPFDEKEFDLIAPYGGSMLMSSLVTQKGYPEPIKQQIITDKQKLLGICIDKFMVPNQELVDLIITYHRYVGIGVVSNGRKDSISQILKKLGIINKVDLLITREDTELAKPSAQPYMKAMRLFHTIADEVMVFEDNHIGFSSAIAAGIRDIVKVDKFYV